MNQSARSVPAPMARAVMQPLHDGANDPEHSNRCCQPDRQRVGGAGNFMNESPGEQREDRQGDRNENDVDVKNFPNEERRPIEIGFPFHDADEKQIQNRNRKLCNCGDA